jgi:hypothetical protein
MDLLDVKNYSEENSSNRSQYTKQTRKNKKLTNRTNQDNNFLDSIRENGYIFNIFGSPNGNDLDILVLVNKKFTQLKTNQIDRICVLYSEHFKVLYPDTIIDINLVFVEHSKIIWVGHGTTWETNNALFATYNLHTQKHSCFVDSYIIPTTIEINNKLHRAIRNILSMYTRSIQYRDDVKKVLSASSTLNDRLNVVRSIDNSKVIWAENRNDITKINKQTKRACYQSLQALCAITTPGLYTKEELYKYHPEMKNFLYRDTPTFLDYINLNLIFVELTKVIYNRANLGLINLNETEV